MKRPGTALAAAALLAAACSQAQRPYAFFAPERTEAPIDRVVGALTRSGHPPVVVKPAAGLVQTRWEDTGFLYGQIDGVPATLLRRYTVTLLLAAGGAEVNLRADEVRCPRGAFVLSETAWAGACQSFDGVVPAHQEELDRLGEKLERILGGRRL
jgi:hypothetical protein